VCTDGCIVRPVKERGRGLLPARLVAKPKAGPDARFGTRRSRTRLIATAGTRVHRDSAPIRLVGHRPRFLSSAAAAMLPAPLHETPPFPPVTRNRGCRGRDRSATQALWRGCAQQKGPFRPDRDLAQRRAPTRAPLEQNDPRRSREALRFGRWLRLPASITLTVPNPTTFSAPGRRLEGFKRRDLGGLISIAIP
jgi:hypothetical protein